MIVNSFSFSCCAKRLENQMALVLRQCSERKQRNQIGSINELKRRTCFAFVVMIRLGVILLPVMSTMTLSTGSCSVLPDSELHTIASLRLAGTLKFSDIDYAAQDFGKIVSLPPLAVLYPGCASDIAALVRSVYSSGSNLTIAARGPGHSVNGQSQAIHGIVIEMETIKGIQVNPSEMFVEASAGELWVDVLKACLEHGLTPMSFTDYLKLSVGGTLSNAGVSGQAYRWGPQINNVMQLEIITGTGELFTCSRDEHRDLFLAALGGLGQFGIITKARISLQPAKSTVRWIRAIYSDFITFKTDQEFLISQAHNEVAFDYLEGFVIANTADPVSGYNSVPFPGTGKAVDPGLLPDFASTQVLYYIELAKNYDNSEPVSDVDQKIREMLEPLNYISALVFSTDVSYFDFLDRVQASELILRSLHQWDVPHPWIDLFVPASKIVQFDDTIFKRVNPETINGPIIAYPLNRQKWDVKMSAQVPHEDVFYLVAFLQSVLPSSGPSITTAQIRNHGIERYCQRLGCKQYLPTYADLSSWEAHFGSRWSRFVENKIKFDPKAILAPGQNIFGRNQVPYHDF